MKLSIKDSGDNTTTLDMEGKRIELINVIVSHMFDNPKLAALILDSNDFYYRTLEIRNSNLDTQD